MIDRITNHILDHGYQLVDVDGKRTRWGWWAPDLIWDDPDETGLRALHILSHLRVALYMTANPQYRQKYQAAYDELITRHRYHLLTRNQKIMVPGHINHSDDELAFLSFYPLLRYERDPALLAIYKESLERSWQIERPERNPLWNVIYAAGTGAGEFDRQETLRTLHEIPMDLVQWSVTNSHRSDVPIDPLSDRFKRRQALVVLPYDELPMSKWNGIRTTSMAATADAARTTGAISCCRIGWGGFMASLNSGVVRRLWRAECGFVEGSGRTAVALAEAGQSALLDSRQPQPSG